MAKRSTRHRWLKRLLQIVTGVHRIHHIRFAFGWKLPFVRVAYFPPWSARDGSDNPKRFFATPLEDVSSAPVPCSCVEYCLGAAGLLPNFRCRGLRRPCPGCGTIGNDHSPMCRPPTRAG